MKTKKLTLIQGQDIHFFEITWEGCHLGFTEWTEEGEETFFNKSFSYPKKAEEFVKEIIKKKRSEGYRREEEIFGKEEVRTAKNLEFEELIASDPKNRENYLVYADWLQIHGDPRGRLIVVQNELQKNPSANLKNFEQRILEKYREHFFGFSTDISNVTDTEWHLGYIKKLRLFTRSVSPDKLDKVLVVSRLLSNPSTKYIEQITFHSHGAEEYRKAVYHAFLNTLTSRDRPRLKKIQIGHPRRSNNCVIPENFSESCPHLEEFVIFCDCPTIKNIRSKSLKKLVLGNIQNLSTISPISQLTWPKLETFTLSVNSASIDEKEIMRILFEKDLFPKLKNLTILNFADMDKDFYQRLANSPLVNHLETLQLRHFYHIHEVKALKNLVKNSEKFQHLKSLMVSHDLNKKDIKKAREYGLNIVSNYSLNLYSEYGFRLFDASVFLTEQDNEVIKDHENEEYEEYYSDPDIYNSVDDDYYDPNNYRTHISHTHDGFDRYDDFDESIPEYEEIDEAHEEFDDDNRFDPDEEF